MCTVLIVTCNEIYSSVKRYQWVRDWRSDFSATKRVDYSYEGLAYINGEPVKSQGEKTVTDMYDGISEEGSAKLQSLIGEFQERRKNVTQEVVEQFFAIRMLEF